MNTLRPYDFFLNEDAPAYIDQSNGLLSVGFQCNSDCFIGAALPTPASWNGQSVKVRLHVRSTGEADKVAAFKIDMGAWPTAPNPDGPINVGDPTFLQVPVSSINPAIIKTEWVEVDTSAFVQGMTLNLQIACDTANTTTDFQTKVVMVEYML